MANQNLELELARYRAERAAEPQFYYNELADRGRALAELRPLLENFLSGRLALGEFVRGIADESRRESNAARGRTVARYWRFNSAGRLFLDSFLKQAESQSRLNSAGQLLQLVVAAPATLNEASQKIEKLATLAAELTLSPGHADYVCSYFWAIQQPQWPVFDATNRTQLARLQRLAANLRDDYNAFYIAFQRLASELQVANMWEVESFLHWLAQRDSAAFRLLLVKPRKNRSEKQDRKRAEELRRLLEPALHAALGSTFVGKPAPDGGLLFNVADEPFRLELRQAGGEWQWGLGWDGFNPAELATPAGEKIFGEIKGFLQNRQGYFFYAGKLSQPLEPDFSRLADEFWLLRSPGPHAKFAVEDIISEWKLLYPFACRLLGLLDEDIPDSQTDFSYPAPDQANHEEALKAVAESPVLYSAADPPATEAVQPAPRPTRDENANLEVNRVARLKPAPLTPDQLEGLTAYVRERLVMPVEKITEIVTHLEAGRNLLLYGPPGSGKTRLARLIAGQMCAPDPGWSAENAATNYTLATATAEWSQYDTLGGIRPGLAGENQEAASIFYYFEPGVVARAALACEESLRKNGRPHYLIIDEFNRANQERAFGELFTLLEYRDRPLLPGARVGRAADLFLSDAMRIIGTLNAEDRNTVFEIGQALRRRFAMVEIGMPPPVAERKFLPKAVKARLPSLELTPQGEFAAPELVEAADRLTEFLAVIRPDPQNPGAGGREIGTAPLIESLLFCAVATTYYDKPGEALEDAILANILPQLEGAPAAVKRALAAVPTSLPRVKVALQKMTGYF